MADDIFEKLNRRIITTDVTQDEHEFEQKLRPADIENYIGQEKVKSNMLVYMEAARMRGDTLDHVLLYGPAGLGKTSLSFIIANEMKAGIKTAVGPKIQNASDIATILNDLSEGDILFIDEIHRLNRMVEEILYLAMEDFVLDIIIGKGAGAKSIRLNLPRFTLIGATTRIGLLTTPLRDRFGIIQRLELYNIDELKNILARSAGVLGITLDSESAGEIARRSRGTPRIANKYLQRVRDFAQVRYGGQITPKSTSETLNILEVDSLGLEQIDRELLLAMINKFSGGPVGLETLAVSINENSETVEEVYEPYLIQLGFIQRTPRGRVATELAYRHFGLVKPGSEQLEL